MYYRSVNVDDINPKDKKGDAYDEAHKIIVEDVLEDERESGEVIKDDPPPPQIMV